MVKCMLRLFTHASFEETPALPVDSRWSFCRWNFSYNSPPLALLFVLLAGIEL